MPTYEYQCLECSYTFDVFQKINEEPLKDCPHCGGKLQKLISAGYGLIFKGSGFYSTDYRKNTPAEEKKSQDSKDTTSGGNCSCAHEANCPQKKAKGNA
ncbi:MAG: zinc ribbon domain-containing protein [Candidatus Omnitrophota bacterium]|nr:MAG: zinc ribbon domain-containing protein [Candidatus Omnitrophota bacterium]